MREVGADGERRTWHLGGGSASDRDRDRFGGRLDAAPSRRSPPRASARSPRPGGPGPAPTLLDNILVGIVVFLVLTVVAIGGASLGVNGARGGLALFGLLYAILMLAYHAGQTVGKEVAHVRVLAEDGSPVGLGRAAGRELIKALFALLVLPYVLDVLWPLWQPENRALHDLAAGTRVVKAPRGPSNGYYPAAEA